VPEIRLGQRPGHSGELEWSAKIESVFSACGNRHTGAVRQAFINWVQNHPEHWTEDYMTGVMAALRETWPCRPPYP
jgi:hypothetical protein